MIQTFRSRKKREREREWKSIRLFPSMSAASTGFGIRQAQAKVGEKGWRKFGGRNVTAACPRAPLLSKLIRCAKGMMKLTVARGHGKADAEPLHLRCIKAIHPDAWRTCIHVREGNVAGQLFKASSSRFTLSIKLWERKGFLVLSKEISSLISSNVVECIRVIDLTFVEQYFCNIER